MIHHPPILRNSLLALPVIGTGAAFSGGAFFGWQVVVAGIAAIVNLALLSWLSGQVIGRVSRGEHPGLAGMAMSLKLAITVPLFALLMELLAPLAAVIGFTTVVVGVAITGLSLAVLES